MWNLSKNMCLFVEKMLTDSPCLYQQAIIITHALCKFSRVDNTAPSLCPSFPGTREGNTDRMGRSHAGTDSM